MISRRIWDTRAARENIEINTNATLSHLSRFEKSGRVTRATLLGIPYIVVQWISIIGITVDASCAAVTLLGDPEISDQR